MSYQRGRLARLVPLAGLGLALAGCSGWSFNPPMPGEALTHGHNLAAVEAAAPQSPQSFDQALAGDYASYANALEKDHRDYKDVDYFSRKGLAAASGKAVPPENNANWMVPLEVPDQFRTELAQGRQQLVAALDGGARERAPGVAARAQVSYDCWVERMEDDWQSAANGPCRQQFQQALAQLSRPVAAVTPSAGAATPPPTTPQEYRVYFDFNQAGLVPDAQQLVDQVAAQTKRDPNLRVVLVGKADRAGTDQYNMALSERRADTVRNALVASGVPTDRIVTRWVGEREPPVPTPQGVREPRNRVVEIAQQP